MLERWIQLIELGMSFNHKLLLLPILTFSFKCLLRVSGKTRIVTTIPLISYQAPFDVILRSSDGCGLSRLSNCTLSDVPGVRGQVQHRSVLVSDVKGNSESDAWHRTSDGLSRRRLGDARFGPATPLSDSISQSCPTCGMLKSFSSLPTNTR